MKKRIKFSSSVLAFGNLKKKKTFLSKTFYKLLEDYRKNMKDASGSSHNPNLHDVNGRVQFSLDFSNTG